MNKAIKVLFYASMAVAGWWVLRYVYGRVAGSTERASARDVKAYQRATQRWENEGGATLAGHSRNRSNAN
jgi:hypothetical protein